MELDSIGVIFGLIAGRQTSTKGPLTRYELESMYSGRNKTPETIRKARLEVQKAIKFFENLGVFKITKKTVHSLNYATFGQNAIPAYSFKDTAVQTLQAHYAAQGKIFAITAGLEEKLRGAIPA